MRALAILCGLIFFLHGLDGVIGGNILPTGEYYPSLPNGAPIMITGFEARLVGLFWVLFGLGFIAGTKRVERFGQWLVSIIFVCLLNLKRYATAKRDQG